ncbi:MAG TPA: N-acetyltransferase [Pirellulales bacterium]|jgi:putative acetyltransferase
MQHSTIVRPEQSQDFADINEVTRLAFGQEAEARLVRELRACSGFDPLLSLVAVRDHELLGHILFTPVEIQRDGAAPLAALALAPLSVLPQHQRAGVGSLLVRKGLTACRRRSERLVIVVGHPDYYPRFGFRPARPLGLEVPFAVPDEAFLVCDLARDSAAGNVPELAPDFVVGLVQYPPPFLLV